MTNWMLVSSPENFERVRALGFPFLAMKSRHIRKAEKVVPGDRVLFYSDGITEARSPDGSLFGDDRLEQVVKDTDGECFDTIMSSIRKHCGDTPFTDDCTLLELSYRGRHIDDTDPKGLPVMA